MSSSNSSASSAQPRDTGAQRPQRRSSNGGVHADVQTASESLKREQGSHQVLDTQDGWNGGSDHQDEDLNEGSNENGADLRWALPPQGTQAYGRQGSALHSAPAARPRALVIPPRAQKPASNPGGLYGDATLPTSLPAMPVLSTRDAAGFNAWKTRAKAYFQANGLTEYVLYDSRESLQRALNDDLGNRSPETVRLLWVRTQGRIYGVIRSAVEAKLGTTFFDRIEAQGRPDVSSYPADSVAWLPMFQDGNASYLWHRLSQELMTFHPHDLAVLMGRYMSLKYQVGQDPVMLNNAFETVVRELEIAGLTLPSKLHMTIWYRAIPDELAALKQTLSANPKLTQEDIFGALLAHHQASKSAKVRAMPKPAAGDTELAAAAIEAKRKKEQAAQAAKAAAKAAKNKGRWCSYHNSDYHDQSKCNALKAQKAQAAQLRATGNTGTDDPDQHAGCFMDASVPEHAAVLCPLSADDAEAEHASPAEEKEARRQTYFIFDSGATTHLVGERRLLTEIANVPEPISMTTAVKSARAVIRERGVVQLTDKWRLLDVAYVSGAQTNLISEGRLCDAGYSIYKDKDFIRVMCPAPNQAKVALEGFRAGKLWVFPLGGSKAARPPVPSINTLSARKPVSPAHMGDQRVHKPAPAAATKHATQAVAPGGASISGAKPAGQKPAGAASQH
jgi:Pol polyprotein, beta-barrel domain